MDVVWTVKKKSLPLCSRNQLYVVTYFPSLRKIVTVTFQPCCLVCSPVSVQGLPFHHLIHFANCRDTWYERHGIGGDPAP